MKTWNTFFKSSQMARAVFAALLLCTLSIGAFAQQRVNKYIVTTPTLTYSDISSQGATEFATLLRYYNYATIGTLPFDFNYDNTVVPAGTTLYVWEGAIELGGLYTPEPTSSAFASASLPASIVFCASYTCEGSGQQGYGCYYLTTGVKPNRVFTIQMNNVHTYDAGTSGHGGTPTGVQVKLYESSNVIQILYQDHSHNFAYSGYPCSIGLDGFTSPSFASLSYATSQTNSPSTDLNFSPIPPQELSLTPNPKTLNFGTHTPQNPITLTCTASSVGPAGSPPLTITSYGITGSSAYSIVGTPPAIGSTIPAGGVTFQIQFLPLANGNINGAFRLVTNGVDSGTQVMALNGIGAVPVVSYSANNMFRGVNTEVTDTSGVQYLYVNSIGGGPLVVNGVSFIGVDGPKAYIITHLPAGSISPGGVDSIGVKFTPDLEGQPDAKLVINTTAVNIPHDTVSLFGVGILPHLSIDSGKSYPLPYTVNFDSVKLGSTACQQVQLWNPGSDTLAITKNYYESSDFDFSVTPLTGTDTIILPGNYKNVQMCFTPLQQGTRVATFRIRTNIPHTLTNPQLDTSSFVVNVVGIGVPTGQLTITGPLGTDSSLIGTQKCETYTLSNTGAASLVVNTVTIGGTNAADFTGAPTLPLTLNANSSQTFSICANPSEMGAESAVVTATGTSGGTALTATHNLGVFGLSNADVAVVLTPFAAASCGSDTEIITVTNTGNESETYTPSVAGSQSADFTVTPASATEVGGGVATFTVVFNGASSGETATLNFVTTGTPITPFTLTASAGGAIIAGTQMAPMTAVGATSAPFTVTVNNTGTCQWTSGTPTVDPQFTYVSGAGAIAAGGSASFMFTYTPTTETPASYPVTFTGSTGNATVNVNITTEADAVNASSSKGYSLEQNYPNPFSASSQLEMTLPVASLVHLSIIDVQGKTVETVLNQHFDAGTFGVTMNADGLSSGTYYYQMTAGDVTLTRQMVILK